MFRQSIHEYPECVYVYPNRHFGVFNGSRSVQEGPALGPTEECRSGVRGTGVRVVACDGGCALRGSMLTSGRSTIALVEKMLCASQVFKTVGFVR